MSGTAPRDPRERWKAFLRRSGRAPEAVHALHRDLRRERFEGEILARVLGASRVGPSGERTAAVREIERSLGRWRDAELTRALWRSVRSQPSRGRETAWLRRREASLGAEARAHEAAAMASARRLLRGVEPGRSRPRGRARGARSARTGWLRELEARRRRYRRSLRALDDSLPPEAAHRFRQEIRRLGVLYALLAKTTGARPPERSAKVQRSLDRLGAVHDLDRAILRLGREPRSALREEYRTRLRAARAKAAARASRSLEARSVRRYATERVRGRR